MRGHRSTAASPPLVLAALALAGCLSSGPASLSPGLVDAEELAAYVLDFLPVDIDHDHNDALLHQEALNFEFVAYHACTPENTVASSPGEFSDIVFHESYAFVGHKRGFCVLDVGDPGAPRLVGGYEGEQASDIDISADGNHVFLPTQRNRIEELTEPTVDPRANAPRGITVVNVEDKANPAFESYYPVPTNGVHTATAYLMGGRQLLFIQSYDWFIPRDLLPKDQERPLPAENLPLTQRVEVTELAPAAPGAPAVLQRIGLWSLQRPVDKPLIEWFPHDSFPQKHPLTGQELLYVAYWDAGMVILNIDDPTQPYLVSRYDDPYPSIYNAYHDVRPFPDLVAGRHITVAGPETQASREAAVYRLFDTSDPNRPVQLGTWGLPGSPGSPKDFLFSPHVFTPHNGRLYIGHNHGGVWVLDVSTEENLREPKAIGFHFPHGNELAADWSKGLTRVWGAYWHEGYVYATEDRNGVHVLRFLGDAPPPRGPEA